METQKQETLSKALNAVIDAAQEYTKIPEAEIDTEKGKNTEIAYAKEIDNYIVKFNDLCDPSVNKDVALRNSTLQTIQFEICSKLSPKFIYNQTESLLISALKIASGQVYSHYSKLIETTFTWGEVIDFLPKSSENSNELSISLINQLLLHGDPNIFITYINPSNLDNLCGASVQKKMLLNEILLFLISKPGIRKDQLDCVMPNMLKIMQLGVQKFFRLETKLGDDQSSDNIKEENLSIKVSFIQWIKSFITRAVKILTTSEEILKNRTRIQSWKRPEWEETEENISELKIKHYSLLFCFDILEGYSEFQDFVKYSDREDISEVEKIILRGISVIHPNILEIFQVFLLQSKRFRGKELPVNHFREHILNMNYSLYMNFNVTGLAILALEFFQKNTLSCVLNPEYKLRILLPILEILLPLESKRGIKIKLVHLVNETLKHVKTPIVNENEFDASLQVIIADLSDLDQENENDTSCNDITLSLLHLLHPSCRIKGYADAIKNCKNKKLTASIIAKFTEDLKEIWSQDQESVPVKKDLKNFLAMFNDKYQLGTVSNEKLQLLQGFAKFTELLIHLRSKETGATTTESKDLNENLRKILEQLSASLKIEGEKGANQSLSDLSHLYQKQLEELQKISG